MRISLSLSWMTSPETSTVTLCSVPVNRNGDTQSGATGEPEATPQVIPPGLMMKGKVTGASFYRIYRKTSPTAPYVLLTDNFSCAAGASCVYSDAGLTNNVTYYYMVRSVETGHESLNSNEVNGTPKAAAPVRR